MRASLAMSVPPDRVWCKFVERTGGRVKACCALLRAYLAISQLSRGMKTPRHLIADTGQKLLEVGPTLAGSNHAAPAVPQSVHRSPGTPRLVHRKHRPHCPAVTQ